MVICDGKVYCHGRTREEEEGPCLGAGGSIGSVNTVFKCWSSVMEKMTVMEGAEKGPSLGVGGSVNLLCVCGGGSFCDTPPESSFQFFSFIFDIEKIAGLYVLLHIDSLTDLWMSISLFLAAIAVTVAPWCPNLILLCAMFLLDGFGKGILASGAKICKKNVIFILGI